MRWPGASRPSAARLRSGRHPAELAEGVLDLLVVSPGALGWAGAGAVDCRTVLLPGGAGPLARALRTGQAVSYGTSPRDTLTFSSLEGDRICLALQRELVTLQGTVVEQQEMVLPFPAGSLPSALPGHSRNPAAVGHAPGTAYGAPNGGPIKRKKRAFCRSIEAAGCVSPLIYLFILLSLPLGSIPRTVRFDDPDSDKPHISGASAYSYPGTRKPLCNNASFQLLNRLVITCCGEDGPCGCGYDILLKFPIFLCA